MDLALLQQLQTMKRIEDDPSYHFQTEVIDLEDFVPMYPRIIIVDQSIDESLIDPYFPCILSDSPSIFFSERGLIEVEFTTNSLSLAIKTLLDSLIKVRNCWTIILKEGLYIDPHTKRFPPKDLKLEIVGLKDVRFLYTMQISRRACMFRPTAPDLVMRNIRIYDLGMHRDRTSETINFIKKDDEKSLQIKATFINVRIHSPYVEAFHITEGAVVNFKASTLAGCCVAAAVLSGSELHMEDSFVSKIQEKFLYVYHEGTKFTAVNTLFSECPEAKFAEKSRSVFRNCRFENPPTELVRETFYDKYGNLLGPFVFDVAKQADVVCERGFFRGRHFIAFSTRRYSNVSLKGCILSDCAMVAHAHENGSLSITDCEVNSSNPLLAIESNVKGKVEFLRNRLGDTTSRTILVDKISKKPKCDVDGVIYEVYRGEKEDRPESTKERAKRIKVQSKFTNDIKRRAQRLGDSFNVNAFLLEKRLKRSGESYKICENCNHLEDTEAFDEWVCGRSAQLKEKFRYCRGCWEVLYCTVECQRDHWPDHRLSCKGRRGS